MCEESVWIPGKDGVSAQLNWVQNKHTQLLEGNDNDNTGLSCLLGTN